MRGMQLATLTVRAACRAPSTVKATQATTGKTVANAISGVISTFGSYGLNNPTVVSFVNCTACAAPVSTAQAGSDSVQATSVATVPAQLSYYTLTMTFAYNPGFKFAGLSGLFYAAFNATLFQVWSLCLGRSSALLPPPPPPLLLLVMSRAGLDTGDVQPLLLLLAAPRCARTPGEGPP